MSEFFEQTSLDCGATVISQRVESARTIALGIWVDVGSRDETAREAGMSHFMEHMMFKGTPTRDAIQISSEFEGLGAELNAFTNKETTCYYARFVADELPHAMEILCNMVQNSTFLDECIASEREVVLEEIARGIDTPEDYVYDIFDEAAIPANRLGRPIIGTSRTVSGFDHDDCIAYHDAHYHAGNIVIAAAGKVDHAQLASLASKHLSGLRSKPRTKRRAVAPHAPKPFSFVQKDTEQANILYGMQSLPANHPDRFALSLLSNALGGGMSSRLFQEVREKRGLVYAVYTSTGLYQGFGQIATYAGTRPDNIEEVVGLVRSEIDKVRANGITQDELDRTRRYVCGQFIISEESLHNKMAALGRCSTLGYDLLSLDEVIARYDSVTLADVSRVAEEVLSNAPTLAIISPVAKKDLEAMFA